eukprot:TRINITY_DN10627_c0_g1_i3.p1 TRINITY_DN10627_c0_g1~~TRINITY_DN10627_c0_g1_i3.p1  ORF type:complete len:159 (+),score=23.55 TRINITY_DN10627_c0_g1_i3:545-1021(+)
MAKTEAPEVLRLNCHVFNFFLQTWQNDLLGPCPSLKRMIDGLARNPLHKLTENIMFSLSYFSGEENSDLMVNELLMQFYSSLVILFKLDVLQSTCSIFVTLNWKNQKKFMEHVQHEVKGILSDYLIKSEFFLKDSEYQMKTLEPTLETGARPSDRTLS